MKKGNALGCSVLVLLALVVLAVKFCVVVVDEKTQYIVTQFGKAVGDPIVDAGIQFKSPIQKANPFPKQVLEWDGLPSEIPTKDKTYILVDTYARWKIVNTRLYFESNQTEVRAKNRLDKILGSETRNVIAKHDLIETIRTTKGRQPVLSDELVGADLNGKLGEFPPIQKGRALLEEEILSTSKAKLSEFGIELLDIRFKRINYNSEVKGNIYERMKSERKQIAEKFRSEGEGEAAKILGNMGKDLAEIESAAYKQTETIKGAADAQATEIYAQAYGSSADSAEFYEFVRTMELYEKMLSGKSTIVMSTDSDLFKYLKSVNPAASVKTPKVAPRKAVTRAPRATQ